MARSREHVQCRCGGEGVAVVVENQNVPGKGRGVAGDIHHPVGAHFAHGAYRFLVHALSRRVDDHGLGADAVSQEHFRRLGRICADKLGIFDAVAAGVALCVLDGLGNYLRTYHPPRFFRQKQAYRACAAVQVEHRRIFRAPGVFDRPGIQLFGLRRVYLIKRLRGYLVLHAAETVADGVPAPKRVKITGKHSISGGFVDIQYYSRKLGASAAQVVCQRRGLVAEAPGGDDAGNAVGGVYRRAHKDMAYAALAGLFVISVNAAFAHKLQHCRRHPVGCLALQKAALDRHELMRAGRKKSAFELTCDAAHGVNTLVAVALPAVAADDLLGLHGLPAYMRQRIV